MPTQLSPIGFICQAGISISKGGVHEKLKGIGLLLLANILIFITLSISFTILSEVVLPAFGIDIRGTIAQQDLLWAFVFGFGGAFISLAFSKQMARMWLNCTQIIQPRTPAEHLIYETVEKFPEN